MKLLQSLMISLSVGLVSTAALADNSEFSTAQKNQIQQIVHDYLVKNPAVLVEAQQALEQQQEANTQKQALQAIPVMAKILFNSSTDSVAGNPKGNVTIVEFFDYQCGHCKSLAPTIAALLNTDKDVRVIYKQLPIFGANSQYAAKAALAAGRQGVTKFIAFHSALMQANNPLTQDVVIKAAADSGLNVSKLQSDMNDPVLEQEIKANYAMATALGVIGTPALVVASNVDAADSKKIKAVYIGGEPRGDMLQQAIATVRAK